MENHNFTETIVKTLNKHFPNKAEEIYEKSELLQYLNIKTRSANSGSKSRGSFGNIYALYVLIEDYIKKGYIDNGDYSAYEGAKFSDLFLRQRELPFGEKLQNHALNHRLDEEFKRFFPQAKSLPIIRDVETNKYWINENYLNIVLNEGNFNIAKAVLEIIDAYVEVKTGAFNDFIKKLDDLKNVVETRNIDEAKTFIINLLNPNVDARLFEIVSYAILKYHYLPQEVFFGFDLNNIEKENLTLYKTGRTNANDGGIDFVMKPLGRFFQVTETLDVKKYFLDIDKIHRYPITFVVKSDLSSEQIKSQIEEHAKKYYPIQSVVKKYMDSIEEIINIESLRDKLDGIISNGNLDQLVTEIELQSKVEFNFSPE